MTFERKWHFLGNTFYPGQNILNTFLGIEFQKCGPSLKFEVDKKEEEERA